MLLSAQRVVTGAHALGVNCYAYDHRGAAWSSLLPDPFTAPMMAIDARIEVPGGGNLVVSYFDAAVPDGTGRGRIYEILIDAVHSIEALGGPIFDLVGDDHALRWWMQPTLLPHWKHEVKDLMRRILLP